MGWRTIRRARAEAPAGEGAAAATAAGAPPAAHGETDGGADEPMGAPGAAAGRGQPRRRGRRVALGLLVALLGLGAYVGLIGWRALGHATAARDDLRRVDAAVERARSGDVDAATLAALRDELAAAERSVGALQGDLDLLGPLLPLAERLPRYGPRIRADRQVVGAALHLARAGRGATGVAAAAYAGLERGGEPGRAAMLAAVAEGTPALLAAVEEYRRGRAALAAVDRARVEPALRPTIEALDRQLPRMDTLIEAGAALAPALPALLGDDREATYLLLMQDPGELRPTGGFIGNYGLLGVRDASLASYSFQDVYLVDLPYLAANRPLPHPFDPHFPQATAWGLRDSNAWPDFPTSARAAIELAAAEGVAPRVDGVVAITPEAVARLLAIVGPVTVPEFDVVVDARNVEAQIRFHQYEGAPAPDPRQYQGRAVPYNASRKRFTALLAQEVAARLRTLPADRLPTLLREGRAMLARKSAQVYLADPGAQAGLAALGVDGALRPGEGDFVWPVETNLGANKADLYVARDLTYAAQLAADGSAAATLRLGYEFRPTGKLYNDFGYDYFRAYVAAYRPGGARLVAPAEGVEERREGGAVAHGQLVEVRPNTAGRIELRSEQPAVARRRADGNWEYRLRVPRQAGATWRTHTLAITLPPGATPVALPPGAKLVDRTVTLTGVPSGDLDLAIVYALP
jgi:hypothetical protein